MFLPYLSVAILGYCCGSISSAILVCRAFHLPDPRTQGSGNPGATNVLRVGGKKAAALTLAGDVLKGLLPVLCIRFLFSNDTMLWLIIGLAAFIGHLWPIFFRFQGGKGVATAIGVLFAWSPLLGLCCLIIWLSTFVWTRVSSLSALIAAFCAPWLAFILLPNKQMPIMIMAMVGLLIYRHRDNIKRLRNGEESVFRRKD